MPTPGGRCISFSSSPKAPVSSLLAWHQTDLDLPGGLLGPPGTLLIQPSPFQWGLELSLSLQKMAHPGVSVKSLVSSYETRVGRLAPRLPQRRGCVSSPCSPRGASPIRDAPGPPPHRGLGGPGHRPSPRRGVDKTLLSLILYCHRYLGTGQGGRRLGYGNKFLGKLEVSILNSWVLGGPKGKNLVTGELEPESWCA